MSTIDLFYLTISINNSKYDDLILYWNVHLLRQRSVKITLNSFYNQLSPDKKSKCNRLTYKCIILNGTKFTISKILYLVKPTLKAQEQLVQEKYVACQ